MFYFVKHPFPSKYSSRLSFYEIYSATVDIFFPTHKIYLPIVFTSSYAIVDMLYSTKMVALPSWKDSKWRDEENFNWWRFSNHQYSKPSYKEPRSKHVMLLLLRLLTIGWTFYLRRWISILFDIILFVCMYVFLYL